MKREDLIYGILEKTFLDRTFLKEAGYTKKRMAAYIKESDVRGMAVELSGAADSQGRFAGQDVLKVIKAYFDCLDEEPEEGWLKYCYEYLLEQLFPGMGSQHDWEKYHKGMLFVLQTLRGLYEFEEEYLPFDPTRAMRFLSDAEVEAEDYTREYIKLHRLVRSKYIYEFMRIGIDITPFNTLGHIGGVHYVAMFVARQLKKAGVPIDLGIVSGAAAGHDIGKYGCRKSEERRIPYLHYYYTDLCYERFEMPTIGHIAANHSTWDLELENLSVESLVLIYADFRVKSDRTKDGSETVNFYTLGEAFDVILNKLDNVDAEKKQRYQKVYAKLEDFEQFMIEQGVTVALPDDFAEEPEEAPKPLRRKVVLLEGEDVVKQLKFAAIDHNIRLMGKFHVDSEFGNLIEAARSERHWKNIRTYISIFDEYSTYMTEKQKMMTIKFLYELLANKEGDIRTQSAALLGRIIGMFNEDYKKELPEGVTLPDKAVTNVSLFEQYMDAIINPDHKLTEQHKHWIENSLNSFVKAVLTHCRASCRDEYMSIIIKYYESFDYDEEVIIILLKTVMDIKAVYCNGAFLEKMKAFIDNAKGSESISLRVAAIHAEKHLFADYAGEDYLADLMETMDIQKDAGKFTERQSNMFLDDLKAGTPWVIKVANIELMLKNIEETNDKGNILHVGTHLANLVKVSETVTVRKAAGEGLLKVVDKMPLEQRNELSVELFNGLEIGDYQFSKYIPDYLGIVMLRLPPKELDESIDMVQRIIETGNDKVASSAINTLGVMVENYYDYRGRFMEATDQYEARKIRLLYLIIKGFAYYDPKLSQEAFWVLAQHVFGSETMDLAQKDDIFKHCYKKIMTLLAEKNEDTLEFYNNAAVLNHIYRYISQHQAETGGFDFSVNDKVAFYPGTFDPFSLGHKAVAKTIRDMGFDVYLALDEFSWSKHTQPRLQRRKIMNMSVADEEHIYTFPDDMSVNIANPKDVKKLKEAFAGKELYIAVGTDVIKNASCYKAPPVKDSIHSVNHIAFAREAKDPSEEIKKAQTSYPITGKIVNLTLKKYYEDISSTRIRENIDLNRDISNLIDPVAQNYIYERNLYLREPAYKHVLQAKEIGISTYERRDAESLEVISDEMKALGYDMEKVGSYLEDKRVRTLFINSAGRSNKTVAYAAAHRLETSELLDEFGSASTASHIREAAAGGIAVIGFLFSGKIRSISNVSQIIITEVLTELISRDFAYAVYNPVDDAGLNPRIIDVLKKQGFVNITEDRGARPVYAVDMKSPVVVFRDVETVIKSPLNKNGEVLHAIDEAHTDLLRVLTDIYPGELVLSFNTSAVHNKIINKVAEINGVPCVNDKNGIRGPYMSVPFGKALADVLVPNTVTKSLHTEKYFNRDLNGFTIAESRHYSALDNQIKTIRSFNRPVILIDDLLHKGYRMSIIDPIFRKNKVDVKEIVVGVMTGNARDMMTMRNRKVESAYFLPTLKVWLNERDCYPFIGGDSIKNTGADAEIKRASVNLIMPYTTPEFIAHGDIEAIERYSRVCLENARNIWKTLEKEYQTTFERKLTLKRIGEVITYPRIPELGVGVELDENLAPSQFIENAIERLTRLKWGDK